MIENDPRDHVVLLNENHQIIGTMDKLEAHQKGHLHLAFSIFVFNSKRELLIQQRAATKYHGANLWTNTCCSHPQWEENIEEAAIKRLKYEMDMQCKIDKIYDFVYHARVENNLIEHELDHVFYGISDDSPICNAEEVQNFKWMSLDSLTEDVEQNSQNYTYWFKSILPKLSKLISLDQTLAK